MIPMREKKRRASKARVRNRQLLRRLRHERRNKWIAAVTVVARAFFSEMMNSESLLRAILPPTEIT